MVKKLNWLKLERIRKGKELKAPHYTSATASYDNYITIYNIIPNKYPTKASKVSYRISYLNKDAV